MADQTTRDSSLDRLKQAITTAFDHSLCLTLLRRGGETVATSRLAAFPRWIGRIGRQSFLYRWLSTEPAPEIIVIDLRETFTLGPFIVLLDRSMTNLTPYVRNSRLTNTITAGVSMVQRAPIRIVSVALIFLTLLRWLSSALADELGTLELGIGVIVLLVSIVGLTIDHSLDELSETRMMKTIMSLLEPPEAPINANEPPPSKSKSE